MSLVDPVKYIIKDLSLDTDISAIVNQTTDSSIEGTTSGRLDKPRVFLAVSYTHLRAHET